MITLIEKPTSMTNKVKCSNQTHVAFIKAIWRAMKTTHQAIQNRIPRLWLHIDLLMQLTIKKAIFDNMRDMPVANKSHNKKSANIGYWGHNIKYFSIATTVLLLKDKGYKTRLVTIRVSFNLADPLTSEGTNIGRKPFYMNTTFLGKKSDQPTLN